MRLAWGIRQGFRDYLAALEDARIELDGVESTPEGFLFGAAVDGRFPGRLHVTAHAGALDVTLADPALERTASGLTLTAAIGAGRVPLARLLDAPPEPLEPGSLADVALTIEGSTWLGGVYAPWARMDPVHLRAG